MKSAGRFSGANTKRSCTGCASARRPPRQSVALVIICEARPLLLSRSSLGVYSAPRLVANGRPIRGQHCKRGANTVPVEQNTGRQPRGMLVLRTMTMPRDANPNGDIFGGWILSQMDIAGGLMAAEVAQGRVVTVTVDKMVFQLPVRVGQAVCVHAELLQVGNSSMDIKLEVWARELVGAYEAARQLVTEGVFRYVAVDDRGSPRRVPDNPKFFSRADSAKG
jgi:acyl-CoA thioesterase YciA